MLVFGRSLGGAVAISLAHSYPDLVSGIIVENTFLSVGAMVDVLMPFLKHIRHLVLFMNWGSDAKIPHIRAPILFISGMHHHLLYAYISTVIHLLRCHMFVWLFFKFYVLVL